MKKISDIDLVKKTFAEQYPKKKIREIRIDPYPEILTEDFINYGFYINSRKDVDIYYRCGCGPDGLF